MKNLNYELLRKFVAPEFVFGAGARFLAGHYVQNLSIYKPMIVTDPGVAKAGWPEDIARSLADEGIQFSEFSDVTANPKDHEVIAGAEKYRAEGCDALIAAGGGSVIDCAKGIGILVSNGGSILQYEGVDKISVPCPPLICIPTTAGSAADVSQFAIITDTEKNKKITIISKVMVPDVSLIDPETTCSNSPDLTACTGLDVLTHASEALASNASSPVTDLHALEAVRLVAAHLFHAYTRPSEMIHRSGMMQASLHAGLAFSNASLGAVHAMAHSLGGLKDAPHGLCNAVLLPTVVRFNYESSPDAYRRLGEAMGLSSSGVPSGEFKEKLLSEIRELSASVGLRAGGKRLGIKKEEIPTLAAYAAQDPCIVTNPRHAETADLEKLYAEIL